VQRPEAPEVQVFDAQKDFEPVGKPEDAVVERPIAYARKHQQQRDDQTDEKRHNPPAVHGEEEHADDRVVIGKLLAHDALVVLDGSVLRRCGAAHGLTSQTSRVTCADDVRRRSRSRAPDRRTRHNAAVPETFIGLTPYNTRLSGLFIVAKFGMSTGLPPVDSELCPEAS
jgi:hypothetical protein